MKTEHSGELHAQSSIEWLYSRCAHVTASRFCDVIATTQKGTPTAAHTQYMWDIVSERLTGIPTEHYVTAAMQQGTDREPLARMRYEATTGCMVSEVGFLHHPTIEMLGGSPDGLVDDDGLIEIKSPLAKTHLQTMLSGECQHIPQIQGLLWLTGRKWAAFISFNPELANVGLDFYVQRIERDDEYIAKLSAAVIQFLGEVDEMVTRIKAMRS